MTVQIENRLQELQPYIQELSDLSALPSPTRQQTGRLNALMSIISAIKSGVSAESVKNWEMDELRRSAGLARLPERGSSRLGEQLESEWHNFALKGECRATLIPNPRAIAQNEKRANEI